MKFSEVLAQFQAWLKKWGLRLLFASLGHGSRSALEANFKTIHDKNANNEFVFCTFESHAIFTEYLRITSLPDLTEQISKESSKYPVAQGSFGDVWKCISKPPLNRITVEASSFLSFHLFV
jgi:hypothetical protein